MSNSRRRHRESLVDVACKRWSPAPVDNSSCEVASTLPLVCGRLASNRVWRLWSPAFVDRMSIESGDDQLRLCEKQLGELIPLVCPNRGGAIVDDLPTLENYASVGDP